VRAAVDRLVGAPLEDVRYVNLAWGLEDGEELDPGPVMAMVDSVDQAVAVGLGSSWLVAAWALDSFTPGLSVFVEEDPDLDGAVDGLSGEVWAGLAGRDLAGYELVWHNAGEGAGPSATALALRLFFGDELVTVMLGVVEESGEVDYSVDDLLVVRGGLGDDLVDGFFDRWPAVRAAVGSDAGGGSGGPGPWEELATAEALWDAARRGVLGGGAEEQLRRGLADGRGGFPALRILSSAPLDLVERLFPEILEWALDAEPWRHGSDGRACSAAGEVLGRLSAGSLNARLGPLVEAIAADPGAAPGRVSQMAWLVGRLGLDGLARTLAERPAGRSVGRGQEEPDDARRPQVGTGGGGRSPEPWEDAVEAQALFDEVWHRMFNAGRYKQYRSALRDAAAASAMLRILSVNPPYWTQAVFGDVLGWALGSSDLVGPAREAVGRLPRGWVRFELSGRVAELAEDPGAGWEARTRMGQLLEFLGEADLLAALDPNVGR
jgi:hypothetical protein